MYECVGVDVGYKRRGRRIIRILISCQSRRDRGNEPPSGKDVTVDGPGGFPTQKSRASRGFNTSVCKHQLDEHIRAEITGRHILRNS